MDSDKDEGDNLLCRGETQQIIGCAMDAINELGHGLLEKPYENALAAEFRNRSIQFEQQPRLPVDYKGVRVGGFVPDLLVFDRITVDTKVVYRLSEAELGQMMNYLRVTGVRVGLRLNFAQLRLQWRV